MERSDKSKYPTAEQHAEHIHSLGVRVDWLVAFTYEHDCWTWPTRVVERDIVKPLTRESRCRYAEKSEFQEFVGPARVFMSHTWEGVWGTLVMAAVSGAREDRHVWIDIFAVRQWKFNGYDLDFRSVIGRSYGFILCIPLVQELTKVKDDFTKVRKENTGESGMFNKLASQFETKTKTEWTMATLSALDEQACAESKEKEARAKRKLRECEKPVLKVKSIPITRLWCVVELSEAVKREKGIVIQCGEIAIENTTPEPAPPPPPPPRASPPPPGKKAVGGPPPPPPPPPTRASPPPPEKKAVGGPPPPPPPPPAGARAPPSPSGKKTVGGQRTEHTKTVRFDTKGSSTMMHNLQNIVDIRTSECAVPSDREREMKIVESQRGGINRINTIVSGQMAGVDEDHWAVRNIVNAAACGEFESMQRLLKENTNDAKTLRSCLEVQVAGNRLDLVKELFDSIAQKNVYNLVDIVSASGAPLIAAKSGHTAILQHFLERDLVKPGVHTMMVVKAAKYGRIEILKLLDEQTRDININPVLRFNRLSADVVSEFDMGEIETLCDLADFSYETPLTMTRHDVIKEKLNNQIPKHVQLCTFVYRKYLSLRDHFLVCCGVRNFRTEHFVYTMLILYLLMVYVNAYGINESIQPTISACAGASQWAFVQGIVNIIGYCLLPLLLVFFADSPDNDIASVCVCILFLLALFVWGWGIYGCTIFWKSWTALNCSAGLVAFGTAFSSLHAFLPLSLPVIACCLYCGTLCGCMPAVVYVSKMLKHPFRGPPLTHFCFICASHL